MYIVNINGAKDTLIYNDLVKIGHEVCIKALDEYLKQSAKIQADLFILSQDRIIKEDVSLLRNACGNKWVPIVFLADPAFPHNILEAINNGADDFILPTMRSEELQAKCIAYSKIRARILDYNEEMQNLKINNELNVHYALHDKLTGLANRYLFNTHFYRCMAHTLRYNNYLALLFLDLDDFKYVNDKYGHVCGDQLLQLIAKRLLTSVRKSDMIARFGGDEFLILISDLEETTIAEKTAQHILNNFATPFIIGDKPIKLCCSIGIALYPLHAKNSQDLIDKADQAMYCAKKQGKNCYFMVKSK